MLECLPGKLVACHFLNMQMQISSIFGVLGPRSPCSLDPPAEPCSLCGRLRPVVLIVLYSNANLLASQETFFAMKEILCVKSLGGGDDSD